MSINITIDLDPQINLYTIKAISPSGEAILECLTIEEVKQTTIDDLLQILHVH